MKLFRARPAASEEEREYEELSRARLDHLVEVQEPLVLCSQIHRSGGTLVSQLFDGHPECHAHPHELAIGYPRSRIWPQLDLGVPESWFDILREKYAEKHFRYGYRKPAQRSSDADPELFPFLLPPRLQRRIFDACVEAKTVERDRDVLDCYFTSYFNAWLDNQSLYTGPKKAIIAFAPRMNSKPASIEGLFAAYPDGHLISLVREPRAWYNSARSQKATNVEVDDAIYRWRLSAQATLDTAERFGDRVIVLTYEDLVADTEGVMRHVAGRIGISWSDALLEPTFNGMPIRANSSDRVQQHGVLRDRTTAYRDALDAGTIARVDELAGDLYEQARERSLSRA
jgi:hypothetical protein